MTLIEALLLLPQRGDPTVLSRELASVLTAGSGRFVHRRAAFWSLTTDGQRFLAQFRSDRSAAIGHVAVKLVLESGGPVFHLVCDTGAVLRVARSDLQRSLREIQSDNPDVKIVFDFRRRGHVS